MTKAQIPIPIGHCRLGFGHLPCPWSFPSRLLSLELEAEESRDRRIGQGKLPAAPWLGLAGKDLGEPGGEGLLGLAVAKGADPKR